MKTRHHALLHFGFHDAFDNLARLVSRAILKESHLPTLPLTTHHFGFSILDFGLPE
jgi:hypothetical protein